MFLNHVHLLAVLLSALSFVDAQHSTISLGGPSSAISSPIICDPNLLKIGLCQNGYPLAVQLVAIPCQQTGAACIPILTNLNCSSGQSQPSVPNANSTERPPCSSHTMTPYPPVNAVTTPKPCDSYSVTTYPPITPKPDNSESQADGSSSTETPQLPQNSNKDEVKPPPCASAPTTTTTTPTPTPPCVTPTTPTTTTPSPTATPTTTTTTPAPDNIVLCSEGTVFENGACRQIYCASGAYRNGRCVRVRCPAGTAWTGGKCSHPQPKEFQPIRLKPTIIEETQSLSVSHELNPLVNKFISISQSQNDYADEDESEDEEADASEEAPAALAGNSTKCCHVIAPRTCRCKSGSSRWKCYNRKQQLCGDFCSSSKLVLMPSAVRLWQEKDEQVLLMPPNWCQGDCTAAAERYDCSGCAYNLPASCSPYCFNYKCNSPRCSFEDQQKFCESNLNSGTAVCPSENGWV